MTSAGFATGSTQFGHDMLCQRLRWKCLRAVVAKADSTGGKSAVTLTACDNRDRLPSSDGLSRLLLLERHRHRRVRREANPLPLDVGDKSKVDEMRVALVLALAAVALREPDATVGDAVDSADMDAVRSDHFHVVGDLVRGHLVSPCGFDRLRRSYTSSAKRSPGRPN